MPVVCVTGRVLVYLAAMAWMLWFSRLLSPRARRAAALFYVGLGIELVGACLDRFLIGHPAVQELSHAAGLFTVASTTLVLGSVFIIMMEISRASQRHKREAEIDHLTGLYNRRVFFARAEEALADARAGLCRPAVAILDVDNMKEINDAHGHQCGDEVLRRAARALRLSVRHDDVPARYGGDEFAVLFADSGPSLETLKERLAQYVSSTRACGGAVSVSVSVGVARYPSDGKDIDALLRAADAMMYAEKSNRYPARHRFGETVQESRLSPS